MTDRLEDLADPVMMFGLMVALNYAISGPITAIASSLEAARPHPAQVPVPEVSMCARALERSARAASSVISTLRDVGLLLKRMQSREASDPVTSLEQAVRGFRASFADVDLRTEIADIPSIFVDSRQIERVHREIFRYLAECAPHPGKAPALSLRAYRNGDDVRFEISADHAAPSDLENAFTLAPPSGDEGHPIGLGIARALVVANEGRLWAEQAPEGGARFVLAFPVAT